MNKMLFLARINIILLINTSLICCVKNHTGQTMIYSKDSNFSMSANEFIEKRPRLSESEKRVIKVIVGERFLGKSALDLKKSRNPFKWIRNTDSLEWYALVYNYPVREESINLVTYDAINRRGTIKGKNIKRAILQENAAKFYTKKVGRGLLYTVPVICMGGFCAMVVYVDGAMRRLLP